jgi:hypothetical protein
VEARQRAMATLQLLFNLEVEGVDRRLAAID